MFTKWPNFPKLPQAKIGNLVSQESKIEDSLRFFPDNTGKVAWLKIPVIFEELDECVIDGWTDGLTDGLMD